MKNEKEIYIEQETAMTSVFHGQIERICRKAGVRHLATATLECDGAHVGCVTLLGGGMIEVSDGRPYWELESVMTEDAGGSWNRHWLDHKRRVRERCAHVKKNGFSKAL